MGMQSHQACQTQAIPLTHHTHFTTRRREVRQIDRKTSQKSVLPTPHNRMVGLCHTMRQNQRGSYAHSGVAAPYPLAPSGTLRHACAMRSTLLGVLALAEVPQLVKWSLGDRQVPQQG